MTNPNTAIINVDADILDRIEIMRAQEEATSPCYNYFQRSTTSIDGECRKPMTAWLQEMQRKLNLSPETAWIAASFLDRYASSGKGRSQEALEDKHKYQLATISAFYTAIKIYERAELTVHKFAKYCQGYYEVEEITSMEEDILFALDWRVACPTPMDFVRHFIDLLPPEKMTSSISESLLEASQKHVDYTVTDIYFAFFKPSAIGAACLACSLLAQADILSSSERKAFWLQLAKNTVLTDVMDAQNKLLRGHPLRKPKTASQVTESSATTSKEFLATKARKKASGEKLSSSPVSVSQSCPTSRCHALRDC